MLQVGNDVKQETGQNVIRKKFKKNIFGIFIREGERSYSSR